MTGYTYIIANQKFFSYLTGGTSLNLLDTAFSTGEVDGTTIVPTSVVVTGECISRLSELQKYTVTNVFSQKYVSNGSYDDDGVDMINSNPSSIIIYYIGGIKYYDIIASGVTMRTTYVFVGQGYSNPDFINVPIYKNPNKENIISNPKIYDDVFIVRQELSAFDKNYRLEYMKSLADLTTYAGGNFFKIECNT
jgi:hypothetical protein